MCNLDPEKMLICGLAGSQIKFVFQNEHKIKAVSSYDLTCYEVPTMEVIARSRAGSEVMANNIEQGLKDIQRNQGKIRATVRYFNYFVICIVTQRFFMPLLCFM